MHSAFDNFINEMGVMPPHPSLPPALFGKSLVAQYSDGPEVNYSNKTVTF